MAMGIALSAPSIAGDLLMNETKGNTNLDEVKGSEYETIVVQSDSTIGKVVADPAVNFINVQAKLTVNSDLEANQISLSQYDKDCELKVEGNLTAGTVTIAQGEKVVVSGTTTINGTVALSGKSSLQTGKLVINGSGAPFSSINNSTILADEIEVNHTFSLLGGTISAEDGEGSFTVGKDGRITQQGTSVLLDTVVDGGTITMYKGSFDGITMDNGKLDVRGNVATGALTLNGGELNFSSGSTLDLKGGDLVLGDGVSITLNVDSIDNIEKVALFESTGNVISSDKITVTFVDGTNKKTEIVVISNGNVILYTETYVDDHVNTTSSNGSAGEVLLADAFHNGTLASGGALRSVMDVVHAGTFSDWDAAAVAGASTAVLGQALSGDTDRQLRAIRNRAVSSCINTSDTITVTALDEKGNEMRTTTTKPDKFSVWVNAEGNRTEQDAEGTAAGYTLTSWGGTVGAGMQLNNQLTFGLALTAMYGDLKSDGPDSLDGDMDTTYVSAFARYQRGAWSNVFIGTVGTMDVDYKRYAMGYSNDGDTDGSVFGLMYELSRDFALGNRSIISPVFNISYRHTEVDGYSESGTDAALNVSEQSLDTVTMGLGARYAAVLGQQTLNRAIGFEARALAKYDFGDTQTDTTVGFINKTTRANIESAEMGAFGVELGAGIDVPVSRGSIFADGSMELRSDYTNFNATVGYKIQF